MNIEVGKNSKLQTQMYHVEPVHTLMHTGSVVGICAVSEHFFGDVRLR